MAFIIGALLLIVGNAAIPLAADPGDVVEVIDNVADNADLGKVAFLIIAVGLWLIVLGTAGVYRSISTGAAAAWARLGFYSIIAGTAAFALMTGLLGPGIAMVAEEWDGMAAGADKDAMFQAFSALYWALNGAFAVVVVVYWSATLLLFIGITMSRVYPTWLGWAGLINAAVLIAVGFVLAFADPSKALDYTFGGFAALSTLWVLILGVVITRKAW